MKTEQESYEMLEKDDHGLGNILSTIVLVTGFLALVAFAIFY